MGSLFVALLVIAGAILIPGGRSSAVAPPTSVAPASADAGSTPQPAVLRHGIVGVAAQVTPVTAVTPADRDLVSLVYSGLVALGPDQTVVPALAESWTVEDEARTWTFRLRDDARWHDGEPVTARDVVFTIGLLRDRGYAGPGAGSWRDVSASAIDERTVRFTLTTALGGFLQSATQPIIPAHHLEDVPIAELAAAAVNTRPVGSGPYRVVSLDATGARLQPAIDPATEPAPTPVRTPRAGDPVATPMPPDRPTDPGPPVLEISFHPDAAALAAAYVAGDLDLASGLPPAEARRLAGARDTRLLRYPTTTVTAILFNLRPSRPEFRDAATRRALLRAIDRPGIVAEAWDGQAAVADSLIARASWAWDPAANPAVPYDRRGSADALRAAGWTPADGRWTAPGASEPFSMELLSPDLGTNPGAFIAASSVAADWARIGLTVTHRALPPEELVTERLRTGDFAAAVVDINVGLDPDLYGLLASTQTTSSGLNVAGLVDRELDALLAGARAPGTVEGRRARYRSLQERLAERAYLLPIAFRDELMVARETIVGPDPRQVAQPGDRFWDVLSWRLAVDR